MGNLLHSHQVPLPFPPPAHLLRKQKEISALQRIHRICPFRTCKPSELPGSLGLQCQLWHSRLAQEFGSHCCTPDRPGHGSTGCSLSAPLPSFVCCLLTQSWALPAPARPGLGMAESQRRAGIPLLPAKPWGCMSELTVPKEPVQGGN